jgi:hypothetical protein
MSVLDLQAMQIDVQSMGVRNSNGGDHTGEHNGGPSNLSLLLCTGTGL